MLIDPPSPPNSEQNQWCHDDRQSEVLFKGEYSRHKDLKDDNAPDQTDEGDGPGLALRFVGLIKDYSRSVDGATNGPKILTKEKFVFVHDIGDAEVECSKDHDLRLNHAVRDSDHKDQDRLRIHSSIVYHRGSIQLSKIYKAF
jgi:hypothetical protein